MVPFVFSGQICSLAGTCIAGSISAPVGAGVLLVGGAIAGAVYLGAKIIDNNSSSSKKGG